MKSKKFIRSIAALFGFCFAALTSAQEVTITGIVRDQNTYREIRGADIYIKGTQLGTSSDFAGRYSLRVPNANRQMMVVFRHIGYESREIPLDSLVFTHYVYLQPRIIPLPAVEVRAPGVQPLNIEKDLPIAVSVIEARNFEIRGYVDAGDLLKTDHSVQVEEELSGKKTAAIRGGNPDEVVVLYNGVKMNNAYDNIFDFSLIDLEDIERFEIIKGSNTALYGPEAFSGIINIVPKIQQDYNVRFQQRLGTYRSGNWGLHLYEKLKRLSGSYSFKRGGTKRNFVDVADESKGLENISLHHTANLNYNFPEHADGSPANILSAMYIYTSLDYENRRDVESLSNLNQLLSLKYTGALARIKDLDLSVSLRRQKEEQFLVSGTGALHRNLEDRALYANAEKHLKFSRVEWLFAYQFEHAELDFVDERRNFQEQPVGLESAELKRQHHGLVSIAKIHGDTGSEFFQTVDVDMSLRHDRLRDEQINPIARGSVPRNEQVGAPGIFKENDWQETMFKFALNFTGYRNDLAFNAFLNFGSNTKFPTLFQQVSVPALLTGAAFRPNLNPEKNRSVELGAVISRDIRGNTAIYGWRLSGNFFQNHYDNKFRLFATPGIPIAFYDNSPNARISGFETKSSVFLFRKKVTTEVGLSKYFISEKAAFPFKSDLKRTFNFIVDHAGYSFQLHWFKEGEQVGLVRLQKEEPSLGQPQLTIDLAEITLPAYSNLDLHLSKTFEWGKLKIFVNASGRNLLNKDDVVLQGLAIRDRRYYLTIGAQY